MVPAWILLMLNNLFFTLRLSGGVTGSFPRPLKAEEERRYLELAAQGDLEARNKLIEHNLRLVAHIIKKGCGKRQIKRAEQERWSFSGNIKQGVLWRVAITLPVFVIWKVPIAWGRYPPKRP